MGRGRHHSVFILQEVAAASASERRGHQEKGHRGFALPHGLLQTIRVVLQQAPPSLARAGLANNSILFCLIFALQAKINDPPHQEECCPLTYLPATGVFVS